MILIIAASNGKNLELGDALSGYAADEGIPSRVVDLTESVLPVYRPQIEDTPPAELTDLIDACTQASGFIFCAPEYNGSIPPTLTNAIAWLSVATDEFRQLFNQKPAFLATHSGGGGYKCLMAMRIQLSHLGMHVIGREIACNDRKPLSESSGRAAIELLKHALRP